jgi:hypothetical protein
MALEIPDDWSKDHQKHRKQTRIFAILITLVIWGAYLLLPNPIISNARTHFFLPNWWSCLPFSLTLGYALALLITLFRCNLHRMRAVLRPNIGRLVGSFILAFITPFGFFGISPVTVGFVSLGPDPLMILLFGAVMIGWYVPSCLLISGLKNRFWRFAGFCLMFWASASAVMLLSGIPTVQM